MFSPWLKGHGGSLADFRASGCEQWQESAEEHLKALEKDYDRILLVGHSMGGLLAVRAAIARPEKVVGVVAIGFPIKISIGPRWIGMNMAAARPPAPDEDPRITSAREMSGVPIRNVKEYFSTLPQNRSFLKVTRLTRKEISRLNAPLTVVNFNKDEIVAPSVPAFVRKKLPGAQIHVLPGSYHFLFQPDELETMAQIIREKAGL